jgi:hypothetical protein
LYFDDNEGGRAKVQTCGQEALHKLFRCQMDQTLSFVWLMGCKACPSLVQGFKCVQGQLIGNIMAGPGNSRILVVLPHIGPGQAPSKTTLKQSGQCTVLPVASVHAGEI